ncbi:hypothetical protein [uncultured Winogradskyella sp.]|uniref:hypothetical protein n=1 Tax=uncultured Winogradskyella sp. TaxID=395353 RepID=UPI00262FF303|nr:hypothetical protein [uncultured Winogradskyella sp.]
MIFRIFTLIIFCFCSSLFSQEKSISELESELLTIEDSEQKIKVLEKLWQKTTYENETEAIKYATRSIELAKTISNKKLLAKAYEQLGISHSNISNYKISNKNYKKAIVLQEKLGNTNRIGNILINKGINFKDIGQLDSALHYLEKAKGYLKAINTKQDSSLLAKYYGIKANFLMSKAFYTLALENATKAAKLSKELGDILRYADNLQIIADANESLGNKDISIDYFKESLAIYQKENDTYFEADVSIKIGFLYSNLKPIEIDSATYYYKRATNLAHKIDVPSLKSRALIDHAKLLIKINKFVKAKLLLDESKIVAEKINDTFGLSDIYLNKGLINLRTNNLNKAKEDIEKAFILKQKMGLLSGITEATKNLAIIEFKKGNFKEAYKLQKEFKILSDSIYKKEKVIKFDELQVQFDTQKKESEIALQKEEIKTLNAQAENDKLTKTLYSIGMISFLTIAGLLYFGFKQRIKKNKIEREKQEEIYKQEIAFKKKELASQTLHLVQKNTFIQELKENLEKIKKSPELFKVEFRRLVMLLKKESAEDKDWEVFKSYFSEVHNDFDNKIRAIASDITEKEIRLASFLRMNLSTKEIASMLNVLPDSVLKSKYRLKKKLTLNKEANLTQFLNTL